VNEIQALALIADAFIRSNTPTIGRYQVAWTDLSVDGRDVLLDGKSTGKTLYTAAGVRKRLVTLLTKERNDG